MVSEHSVASLQHFAITPSLCFATLYTPAPSAARALTRARSPATCPDGALRLHAGYTVGGMIHLVLNNQVGFTTAPQDGRSSAHATCAGKAIGAPILHVNADDPAAVVAACQMAADFQHRWHKDVIVDIIGYRRWCQGSLCQALAVLLLGATTFTRSLPWPVCSTIYLRVPHAAQRPSGAGGKSGGWSVCMQDVWVASICLMASFTAVQAWAQRAGQPTSNLAADLQEDPRAQECAEHIRVAVGGAGVDSGICC